MSVSVEISNVSIVFGDTPKVALPHMDQGLSRSDVAAACGQVLGVHDCTLIINEGETLVLMGLSGSGKSTLLRAINGLNPVVRGHVEVNDGGSMVDVTNASSKQLRHIRQHRVAMVFQQFGLLPWRTVSENVGLGLELMGAPKETRKDCVAKQLELVGLTDWSERKVGEL